MSYSPFDKKNVWKSKVKSLHLGGTEKNDKSIFVEFLILMVSGGEKRVF